MIERKNIELKSKNEMDVLSGRVDSVETQLAKLSNAVERLVEQQESQGNKLVQDQHQLTSNAAETMGLLKSLHALMEAQQQQQQQQPKKPEGGAATRGRDAFLNKVSLAKRERQQSPPASSTAVATPPVASSTSPRWKSVVSRSTKQANAKDPEGGGGEEGKR